jgi:hypothetical protein
MKQVGAHVDREMAKQSMAGTSQAGNFVMPQETCCNSIAGAI